MSTQPTLPSTANSPRPAAARRPWPKWVGTLGWSVLSVLAASVLGYLVTVTFGTMHGTEFCPETFERRSYNYLRLPLLHIQLTGENHKDTSGVTETFVLAQNYVASTPSPKQQWHTIVSGRGAVLSKGDAGLLMQYLDAKNSEDYHRWVKWSEEHADCAKLLWPAVQQMAAHKLYLQIPDLFDLAKRCDDPAGFQAELDRFLTSRLPAGVAPARPPAPPSGEAAPN